MPPKNLLLVSLDCLRFDALSAAPDRRLLGERAGLGRTPTLDRIAAEGTFFTRAVTTCCFTSPSHAAIFTGTYWPKHGVLDLFTFPMNPQAEPLAEALTARAYRTAQNAGRGWRDGSMFQLDAVGLNRGYESEAFGGWMRRRTLSWLRKTLKAGPWFLFFHTMAVHRPFGTSHRRVRRLVRRDILAGTPFERVTELYLRSVTSTDERFGRLWEALRGMGALDDTLVVILGDHGQGLSVYSSFHCNSGGWQEGVCRVPLVFWCPGLVKAGQVIDGPVSTVDVAPTIGDLLGLDWRPALGFDGASLAPVVRGDEAADRLGSQECFVFPTLPEGVGQPPLFQAVVKEHWKYVSFAQALPEQWQRLRDECELSARSRDKQSRHYNVKQLLKRADAGELELLFDVAEDPAELNNLAGERLDSLSAFRAAMQDWWGRHVPGEGPAAGPVEMTEAEQGETTRRLRALGYLE